MFGRSNPATSTCGSSRPSSATMSSRTSGVAVAVNAAIGGRPDARSLAPAQRRRRAQPPVVGTEIVAPLRDAVRFVDHEAGDVELAEQLQELIGSRIVRAPHTAAAGLPPARHSAPRAGCRPTASNAAHPTECRGDSARRPDPSSTRSAATPRASMPRSITAGSWYPRDLPDPVGITASTSRPPSTAATICSCPCRNCG